MNARDFKKTIAGFLLLAAIATVVSLYFVSQPSAPTPVTAENDTKLKEQNAFTEQVPQAQDAITSNETPDDFKPTINDPSNLTEVFAANYSQALMKANPNGLAPASDGKGMDLNLPGQGLDQILAQSAQKSVVFPETPTSSLRLLKKYTANDIINYENFVTSLFRTLSSNPYFSLAAQDQNPELLDQLSSAFSSAYDQALITPAPQPLAKVQKNLLDYLAAEKSVYATAFNYENDPLKAALAMQDPVPQRRAMTLVDSLLAAQNISLNQDKSAPFAFLLNYFSIPRAYAQGGVSVPTFETNPALQNINTNAIIIANNTAATAASTVTTAGLQVKKTVLEQILSVLISKLITLIQNMTLSWIAGNGKPKFITNWQTFLGDTAVQSAQIAFNQYSVNLCGNIRLQLKGPLFPVNYANQLPPGCTLNQLKSNLLNFYNDFRHGGWVAYGQTLQPNNNYYGSYILMQDYQLKKQGEATNAAQSKSIANGGFNGIRKCVKWGPAPDATPATSANKSCASPSAQSGSKSLDTLSNGVPGFTDTSCATDQSAANTNQQQACLDYQDVTPGQAVGMSLNNAIGLKNSRLVNAQQLSDLVSAIIDGAINRIIGMGLSGLSNLANGAGSSHQVNDNNNYLSEDKGYYQYGQAGNSQINSDINQSQTQLNQLQNSQLSLSQAQMNDEQWFLTANTTIQNLSSLFNICTASSTVGSSATLNIAILQIASSTVSQELSEIKMLEMSFQNGTVLTGDTEEAQAIIASSTDRLTKLQTLEASSTEHLTNITNNPANTTAQCALPL